MRNPFVRLTHRNPAKPTLRERASTLRASLAQALGRGPSVDANPGRRALVAGAIASAVAAPRAAVASSARDADQQLAALIAPFRALVEAEAEAERAADDAVARYRACRPDRPAALFPRCPQERALLTVPEENAEGRVSDPADSHGRPRSVVTVETLHEDLAHYRPRSKARRLVESKLPIAEVYEAAETEARATSGIEAALASRRDARKSIEVMAIEILGLPATTLQGIAFQAAAIDALRRPDGDSGIWLFAVHGRGFRASIKAVLGDPMASA